MSRKVSRLPYLTLDVPRVSGDEPQVRLRRAFVGVCSPRERGMGPGQCHAERALQRVPCVSGDEPEGKVERGVENVCSPRERG